MLSCDDPCSPPQLPIWSTLWAVNPPSSSLNMLSPLPLCPLLLPLLPSAKIASNYGNHSTEKCNFSDGKSDCRGYSLPDDLFSEDSQEQLVHSLLDEILCDPCENTDLNKGNYNKDFSNHEVHQPYGNLSTERCNFSDRKSDCRGYSLPDDLFSEDSQEQLVHSLLDEILCDPCENADLNKGNYHKDFSEQEVHQPYGKTEFKCSLEGISPTPSSPTARPNDSPIDFDKDYVAGKCLCKGFCSEGAANKEKNCGTNFETFVTYLVNKVADDLHENVGDHFNSEPNAALETKLFEQLTGRDDIQGDTFAQSFAGLPRQDQQPENVSNTAETEEDINHKSCSCNGEKFNVELKRVNSSLLAEISQLKVLVDNLTHQVQDISDKLIRQSCSQSAKQNKERTVKVNVSHSATEQDIKQFFSFSGDVDHVELKSTDEPSQAAYITFRDALEANSAMLFPGKTKIDQSVSITTTTDHQPPHNIPPPPAYELIQPTSGPQSVVLVAEQMVDSAGSAMPKKKHIFTRVSFVSGAFNKVGRAATNVGSRMKARMKKGIFC